MYKLILADTDEREVHTDKEHKKLKLILNEMGMKASPVYVSVNGKKKYRWKNYIPKEGDIVFMFFEEKHLFSAIFIAAGVITLGVASTVTAVAFGITLLGIGLGLLVNTLFSSQQTSNNANFSANSDSLKNVSGNDMQINPGAKIPLQYGGTWYRPDLLCEPFDYTPVWSTDWGSGDETGRGEAYLRDMSGGILKGGTEVYTRQCACIGYIGDVWDVGSGDIMVVDEYFTSLPGNWVGNWVAWESCYTKSLNVGITPAFDSTNAIGIISSISDGSYTQQIEIQAYQQGCWAYNHEEYQEECQYLDIHCNIRYQSGWWQNGTIHIKAHWKDSFFWVATINAPGANMIKINDVRGSGSFRDTVFVGNITFRQVRFIQSGQRPILKNPEVKAISLTYNNNYQTDSSSLKILALCRAYWRTLKNADLAKEVCASGKGNPADAILYSATNKHCLGVNVLPDERIDIEMLRKFYNYCNARNYNYVCSVTDGRSFQDLIMHIALVGHSRIAYDKYGRLTVIIDDNYDENYNSIPSPVVCLINSNNTIKDSWKVVKSNIDYTQKPTVLRINFVDHNSRQEAIAYIFLDARRYYNGSVANKKSFDDVVNSIDYTKDVVTTLDIDAYEGIRDPYHIFEMGRRQILKQYYTTSEVTFTMGIQANGIAMWDRVWLGHTLLANSIISGKILNKTVNGNKVTLKLDRAILYEVPATLDDALVRSMDAPQAQFVINHIDDDVNLSFSHSYDITISREEEFTVEVTTTDDDLLKTVTLNDHDLFSITNGYFDGIVVGRKPKDDKMVELQVTDYLFDDTCTPNDPFTTYDNAVRLKYGNPYWTYIEARDILPNFWANSVSHNA